MQQYIGTKILNAKTMTRGDYNKLRGWTLPADENGEDEGYLTDNGAGHLQWQPKAVFEDAFDPCDAMDFGMAVAALKLGKRVSRAGWNGKGMWLILVAYSCSDTPEDHPHYHHHSVASVEGLPWIGMKTTDNKFVPWLASQTDMLAEDWMIAEGLTIAE